MAPPPPPLSLEVPVLIVGGGIVGLTASLCLSQHGVQHLLVERHEGTSIHPRARGFNVRAMELFHELGIEELVRDAGKALDPSVGIHGGRSLADVMNAKKRRPEGDKGGFATHGVVDRFSPVVGQWATQDFVEPVILAQARTKPSADIRFYTECVEFEQDEQGVAATIRDRASGTTTAVRAQYMLAADGAGSRARTKLGIATAGKGRLGSLVNILFEADLKDVVDRREFSLCLVDQPGVRGLFASINNSTRWAFQLSYDPAKGEKAEAYTDEHYRELVKLALGMPDVDVKIVAALPWEPSVRVSESLRKGRVFLAGDAAHQMPPWRGQGATSGISDVHNLSWKLAAVLRGEAEPALLDTYHDERHPVGQAAAEMSGAAADEYGLIARTPKAILRTIPSIPRIIGFGYRYESSAVVQQDDAPYLRIPWYLLPWALDLQGRPGTRVPHLPVQRDGQLISTLDACGRNFVLFAGEDNNEAWRKAATTVSESLGLKISVLTVGPSGDLVDAHNHWPYLAGIKTNGALLVRPDGFVAWRAYSQPQQPAIQLSTVVRQILSR